MLSKIYENIKYLYKNMHIKNKDNYNDTKIKTIQEYVYIIREYDFIRLNEDIYKIDKTAKNNPEDRLEKYRNKTDIVAFLKVNNYIECNQIQECKNKQNKL
jgi:hypothetical protein